MARFSLAALAVLIVLAGCNPVVYVPAPVPVAPRTAGLRAGLGGNLAGSQGLALVEVAPDEGMAIYVRGLYANTLDGEDGAGTYVHRGGEVGVVVSRPLSSTVGFDIGLASGRDDVNATTGVSDIGCCSYSYEPFEARVERLGGHVGLFLHDGPKNEDWFRLGPALRIQALTVRERAEERADTWLFVEPVIRLGFGGGPLEFQTQAGLSLPASERFTERYSAIPIIFGATATVRLDGTGR